MATVSSDSDGSAINTIPALPKTTEKKKPNSLTNDLLENKEDMKQKTKEMIMEALMDLYSKKGVSLFALKKYIADRYNVDTKKLKLFIKNSIKSALQEGIIIQTKGIRVSGSFKLATAAGEEEPKTNKPKKEKTEKAKSTKNPERKKKKAVKIEEKSTEVKETPQNPAGGSLTSAKESEEDKPVEPKKKKIDTEEKPKKKVPKEKKPKEKVPKEKKPKEKKPKVKKERVKKVRIPQHLKKPKKITKRRNGVSSSILKPPKMKPQPEI